MSEHTQTRTEHSRSLEDADRYRALETLKELGLLIPVANLETFHGRVGRIGENTWEIDPAYTNGGNDSGNSNVNGRPTLYTSEADIADEFATARGQHIINSRLNNHFASQVLSYTPEQKIAWLDRLNRQKQERWEAIPPEQKKYHRTPKVYTLNDLDGMIRLEAERLRGETSKEEITKAWDSSSRDLTKEVHDIVAADTDAMIIDKTFDSSELSAEDKKRFYKALSNLRLVASEGAPLDFEDRDAFEPFVETMKRRNIGWVSVDDVEMITAEAGISDKAAKKLAASVNAMRITSVNPQYLLDKLLTHQEETIVDAVKVGDDELIDMPISMEYFEKWLREAHIVGTKQSVNSATLGFRNITSISFFDLTKIHTKESMEKKRGLIGKKMGRIAKALEQAIGGEQQLHQLLEDPYVKPDVLVNAASDIKGFKEIFAADAGNWEGFTLAEHTETVLRNFDENYADDLPVTMLAPMRLMILAHDIGKPIAASNGERQNQSAYNVKYAAEFFDELNIDERLKGLMLAIIGKGAQFAFEIDVRKKGRSAEVAMEDLARETLEKYYGADEATPAQIDGFIEMCRILQICDGGAYTTMAVTRKRKGKGRHRNYPSFQGSFEQPVGLGKRDIRLKK